MADANDNVGRTATLTIGNKVIELPIMGDTIGDATIVDISNMFQRAGIMTFDRGYSSTAAFSSAITYIDGDNGVLLYRGYPIEQIAEKSSYLETAYLILKGELPTAEQLKAFERKVISYMPLHEQQYRILDAHMRGEHPMQLIGSMVNDLNGVLGKIDSNTAEGREEIALHLIAKIPTIVAAAHRYSQGQAYVRPTQELGYVENFMRMCFADASGHYVQNPILVGAMERIFILHADHEQNASTSTVRLAGSTGTRPFAAIASGIAALWGPAHGGANEAVLKMLEDIGSVDKIPAFIAQAKQPGGEVKLMGFGHRVYKNFDPRATIIKADCDAVLGALGVKDPLLAIAKELEGVALSDDYFVKRKLYPNVDFYSGIILKAMGFKTEMFTPLFALARTSGWIAQWDEMVGAGKVTIGRPRQQYVGHEKRDFVAIEHRAPNGNSARGTLTAADATRKDAKPA